MITANAFASLVSLAALPLTALVFAGCGSVPPPDSGYSSPVVQPAQTDDGSGSFRTANSLQDLVAKSTVIAVGEMTGVGETVNLARDLQNRMQPDPKILIVGQVYNVRVTRFLKGQGGGTLAVVQPEAYLFERTPKTQDNINKARSADRHIPIRLGIRYLFFLEPLEGFPGKNYLVGPAHPWRFTLPDNGNAVPESPWQYAQQVFPPRPAATLLQETDQLVKGR